MSHSAHPRAAVGEEPPSVSESGRVAALLSFASGSHARACALLIVLALAFFLPGFVSLQPMDRDEPRFAQASKQMLETRDFIDIRFQDDTRYKKPVGIYWLQSASVAAGGALGVVDPLRTIALYRLPSLIGAVAAVLLGYWAALAFVTQRNAFLATAMFAGCILVGVEARLAKTDAVLLSTVVFTMGALARHWLSSATPNAAAPLSRGMIVLFWVVMGLSILIKGPITLMIAVLAAAAISVSRRSLRWLAGLRPGLGLVIMLAIVLPWLAAIVSKTGTAFFSEAIGNDMLGKVAGAKERHGAPPGTYFGVFWATFWPVAPLVALAAPFAWRGRSDAKVLFLLAWVIPSWLVFEAVPTKLPHYVLPLYPPLAMLVMLAHERGALRFDSRWAKLGLGLVALIPVLLLVGLPAAFVTLDRTFPIALILLLAAAAAFSIVALLRFRRGRFETGVAASLAAAFMTTLAAYPFGLPQLQSINLSRRLADAANGVSCSQPKIVTTGYREPSLVFLTASDLAMSDGAGAAQFVTLPGCRIAFVEQKEEAAFLAAVKDKAAHLALKERVEGLNINSGRKLDIGVYVNK
ncbi:MAG: glycosyltransferase family 39 protein [Beijerinckiaceae bacterium]|nr:glycosyltransferase family 39 protein [Beijerinckiaceae bacterium]